MLLARSLQPFYERIKIIFFYKKSTVYALQTKVTQTITTKYSKYNFMHSSLGHNMKKKKPIK